MLYMITLDAHECFGPFESDKDAHRFASITGRASYQLVKGLPPYAAPQARHPYSPR